MADELKIKVKLSEDIQTAKQDLARIRDKGGFSGSIGEQRYKKGQGILTQIQGQDLSKLKGPELTRFLNQLIELRSIIDKGAVSIGNYSKEYLAQQNKVEVANKKYITSQGKLSQALQAQEEALQKIKKDDNKIYINKSTGRELTNIDSIAKAYSENRLQVNKTTGEPFKNQDQIFKNAGIVDYAAALKNVQDLKAEVKSDQVNLQAEKVTLEGLNPTTQEQPKFVKETLQNTTQTSKDISVLQEESNAAKESQLTALAGGDLTKVLQQQSGALGKAFKQFTLYAIIIKSVKKALREAVGTIIDLDKALTEQAMTTGKTRKEVYSLLTQYQELAGQTGATTKEIANISAEYMRQGKTTQEALVLTKAAVSAAKVAGISTADSVNYLTTALNGFRLSAEEAMKVSDKFAAVAAASATSYDEIAIALSKVASQANLAGMSIDYTTALLSKGLETTREAPETIGTALKTIIARMRELTDYGSTLEGDTDINNVETQLNYIGIALKNQNGELRSTEEVLDDLGKKWDTLNTNQQAAVAKALAGTRQQSRLIAMMDDYQRVIELQEISQRASGATMAQMATYTQGMEAALNKVNVAWEKIVTSFVNSDAVVNLVNGFSNILEVINQILSFQPAMIATITTISLMGANIVMKKIQEFALNKQIQALNIQQQKIDLKKNKLAADHFLLTKEETRQGKIQKIDTLQTELAKTGITDARRKELQIQIQQAQIDLEQFDLEVERQQYIVDSYSDQMNLLNQQEHAVGIIGNTWSNLKGTFGSIIGLITTMNSLKAISAKLTQKEKSEEVKKGAVIKENSLWTMVGSAFKENWKIGLAVAAAVGIAIISMAAAAGAFKSESEKTNEQINNLSADIYNLTKTAQSLSTIGSSFDAIDDKLVKTNADLKEMNDLMSQAADQLSDDEKKVFSSYSTNEAKRAYLQRLSEAKNTEALRKYTEQTTILSRLSTTEKAKFLNEEDTTYSTAREAVRAGNNNLFYKSLDQLPDLTSEAKLSIQSLGESMLAQMDISQAWDYALHPEKFDSLAKSISGLKIELNGTTELISDIMTSDDYNLTEKIKAYQTALSQLTGDQKELFNDLYQEYDILTSLGDKAIEYIDAYGLTIDQINNLYKSWKTINKVNENFTQSLFQDNFDTLLTNLQAYDNDISTAIKATYGSLLNTLTGKEFEDTWNAIVNAIGKVITTGILNIGQSVEKFDNTINNFYEKAKSWSTLSETDKTTFLSDNAELFAGDAALYKAFESGDYQKIEEALRNNKTLEEQRKQILQDLNTELEYNLALQGDQRNEQVIAYLKEQIKYYEDLDNIFKADLSIRLEQQNKQLESYKEYLQKEQEALKESLDKRKEAYQDYFDKINQSEEDQDYDEETSKLITNLARLGSSTNADARTQAAELEKSLKDMAQERIDTLRQRAQEQILSNIDDQINNISDTLDDLLNNSQLLLQMMTKDMTNPEQFIADLIRTQGSGMTMLQLQNLIGDLSSTFGSSIGGFDDLSQALSYNKEGDIILNVAGETYNLTQDQGTNIRAAIMEILTQMGKK